MRRPCSILLFLLLVLLASPVVAVESVDEALKALSSEEFSEREAATRYLVDHGGQDMVPKLMLLIKGEDPESRHRAQAILHLTNYGLGKVGREQLADALKAYYKARGSGRISALQQIMTVVRPGEFDVLRLCEIEAEQCKAEYMPQLARIVASYLFKKAPGQEEVQRFLKFSKFPDAGIRVPLAKRYKIADLIGLKIGEIEEGKRGELYESWAKILYELHPQGDAKGYADLLAQLNKEPADVRLAVSKTLVPALSVELLTAGLKVPPELKNRLRIGLSDKQRRNNLRARWSGSAELARAMFMWGNEALALTILERGMNIEDEQSIRDLVCTLFIMGQLETWTQEYRVRFKKDPSVLHRRVLAQMERGSDRHDEAFSLLTPEDQGTRLYEVLAIETGHWKEAYQAVTENREALRYGGKKPFDELQFHHCAAFLAQYAGLDVETKRHLKTLSSAVEGRVDDRIHDRHIQDLVILRRPDLARKVAVEYGRPETAFEIFTLEHRYEEAFEFARDLLSKTESKALRTAAVEFFNRRAPKKANALKQVKVNLQVHVPCGDSAGRLCADESTPHEEPDHEESLRLLANRKTIPTVASIALRNDAAKPENAQLRKRLITWWLNAEMNMGIYLDDMQPVFEADKAWEQLAQMHFEKWRSYHREGGPLYLSGYYLEKAGQVEEGKRRMRIAEFMPLGNSSGHGVMPWQIGKERAPQDLVARQKEVERLGCLGRSGEYRTLQRKLFHPYRKAGKPRKAALLWASANYHFITMSKGGSYSKLLWALNNGMHTEEGLGLDALQQGRVKEAEVRLKESWRLSIEPTWLGAALVQHYQTKGREKDARRIFNLFKDKLEQCSAELPNDPRFKNKLAEWREVTGF